MDPSAQTKPLDPGLHVRKYADPPRQARKLAQSLEAELCATKQEAEAVLAELSAFPAVTAEGLVALRGLTDRVAAAQRIVDRTVDRAAADVSERLAAVGTGIAIHPTSVRDRAAALLGARRELEEAAARLQAGQDEAAASAAAASAAAAQAPAWHDEPVEEEPKPRRRRFFGRRGRARTYEDDTSESTSLLQQVAAATDEAFGARRASDARNDHLVLLRAQRDLAEERVRVAERAWRDLAGDDPVDDVELVVRRFDPQHQEAMVVAQDSAGVRAVSTLLLSATDDWEKGWRSLGLEPPGSVDLEWFARMEARVVRPVVLVGDAISAAKRISTAAPAAAVVSVKPAS
ncbi:MAG: hypothetical protein ABL966_03170 [Acidimicrobiales bacterium]